jgi:hypothetical protein
MLRAIRRLCGQTADHGILVFLGVLGLAWGLSLYRPEPARADQAVEALKKAALSGVGLNQRLAAVEDLRKAGSDSARTALVAIAKTGDLPVQAAACAALGRLQTSSSKGDLKAVLEDTSLGDHARVAAASVIAMRWKDSGDISYLEGKADGNAALEAQVTWLKAQVYKVQ